jgi:photosystem II stability/assembly factor-like uncharacterized protein
VLYFAAGAWNRGTHCGDAGTINGLWANRGFIAAVGDSGRGYHIGSDRQWSLMNGLSAADTSRADIFGVWHDGTAVGFAVGTNGAVLRSQNIGASAPSIVWTLLGSPTNRALRSVTSDGSVVVAVGDGGTILRSSDMGGSWTAVGGQTVNLTGVLMVGTDLFVVGEGGTILHSTDGGASFVAETSGTAQRLNGLWGIGPHGLVAVGDGGTILRRR